MWTCRPRRSNALPASSISAGAWASGTPNLSSLPPVETEACVSPGTSGLMRTSTRWLAGARRLSRATSSALSITISPTPASTASAMSPSDFALPCRRIFSGSNPAFSAIASSPSPATSQPTPSSARIRVTGAHGSALEAKWTSVRGWRDVNSRTYSRAVSRSPCSSNTKAGVPNSAATSASATPPTVRRPAPSNAAVCGRMPKLQANVGGLRDRPIHQQRAHAQQRGDRLRAERVGEPEDHQGRTDDEEAEHVGDGEDRLQRRGQALVRVMLLLRERDDLTHERIIP